MLEQCPMCNGIGKIDVKEESQIKLHSNSPNPLRKMFGITISRRSFFVDYNLFFSDWQAHTPIY